MSSVPLIDQAEIKAILETKILKSWNVPIYVDYPSDDSQVSYGVYISGVDILNRTVDTLGFNCGAIYRVTDSFKIAFVTFQDDPYALDINQFISELVKDEVNGVPLMDGYHSRTYTQEETYAATNAIRHNWEFQMERLDFNT